MSYTAATKAAEKLEQDKQLALCESIAQETHEALTNNPLLKVERNGNVSIAQDSCSSLRSTRESAIQQQASSPIQQGDSTDAVNSQRLSEQDTHRIPPTPEQQQLNRQEANDENVPLINGSKQAILVSVKTKCRASRRNQNTLETADLSNTYEAFTNKMTHILGRVTQKAATHLKTSNNGKQHLEQPSEDTLSAMQSYVETILAQETACLITENITAILHQEHQNKPNNKVHISRAVIEALYRAFAQSLPAVDAIIKEAKSVANGKTDQSHKELKKILIKSVSRLVIESTIALQSLSDVGYNSVVDTSLLTGHYTGSAE